MRSVNTLALDPDNAPVPAARQSVLPAAWRRVLLAGFIVQLLLILFVTTIGLQQLRVTANNLGTVVDVHMRKLSLTKTMMTAARERTLCMFRLSMSHDPIDLQGRLTSIARPIQNRGVDALSSDSDKKAEERGLSSAIPAQNNVLRVLSLLDTA